MLKINPLQLSFERFERWATPHPEIRYFVVNSHGRLVKPCFIDKQPPEILSNICKFLPQLEEYHFFTLSLNRRDRVRSIKCAIQNNYMIDPISKIKYKGPIIINVEDINLNVHYSDPHSFYKLQLMVEKYNVMLQFNQTLFPSDYLLAHLRTSFIKFPDNHMKLFIKYTNSCLIHINPDADIDAGIIDLQSIIHIMMLASYLNNCREKGKSNFNETRFNFKLPSPVKVMTEWELFNCQSQIIEWLTAEERRIELQLAEIARKMSNKLIVKEAPRDANWYEMGSSSILSSSSSFSSSSSSSSTSCSVSSSSNQKK